MRKAKAQREEITLKSGFAIVVDIGKTLSKVSLWARDGHMLDRHVRPNAPLILDGVARLDAEAIGRWIVDTLALFAHHPIEYIIPVGHGAGIAAIKDNALAFAPLDYEQAIPDAVMAEYRTLRGPFAETGSPALPDGLNLGSQIFWLEQLHKDAMNAATLLPWAQYWAWFLSGVAVNEVTSMGCHSDLWNPARGDYASLAIARGWADAFAPLAAAGNVVGTLREDIARKTGLSSTVNVLAGLHDSNAALLAARGFSEIADHEATVLSTGTWFIAMRLPATSVATADLPEARDCLVNVDGYGKAVPSARFMGGREIESIIQIDTRRVDIKPDQPALLAAVQGVIETGTMLLPTLAKGFGPFPDHQPRWINEPQDWYVRRAAVCLYAALVADTSLDLIGSQTRLLVEGRFAEAEVFVRALAALRPDTAVYTANAHNDVSFGALRLIDPTLQPQGNLQRVAPLDGDLCAYRAAWQAALEAVR